MSFAYREVWGGSATRPFFWRVLSAAPIFAKICAKVCAIACGLASAQDPWPRLAASADDFLLPRGSPSDIAHPGSMQPDARLGSMVAWQFSQGPNLSQAGSPLALLETQSQALMFRLPLSPEIGTVGGWRSRRQAFGYSTDSSGAQWSLRAQGWDQALGLRLGPRVLATAHALLPLGPDAQGFAAGAALEIGGRDSTGWLARMQGEWGRSRHDVTAMLPGYLPVTVTSNLESHSLLAGLGWKGRTWRAATTGAYRRLGTPASGDAKLANHVHATLAQGAALYAARFADHAMPWSLEAHAEGLAGQGHEVGYRGQTGVGDPFAWVPWRLQAGRASLRLASDAERYRLGVEGQAAGGVLRLLRPLDPAGHWLWNRNQILDAYQGSLTGIFTRENWTGIGRAAFHREGANAFAQGRWSPGAWDLRPGLDLGLHRLAWEGWTRLTRSQTALLLYTTQTRDTLRLAQRHRWLLQPGASLAASRGRWHAEAYVTQLLPISDAEGATPEPDPATVKPASEWRGGLELRLLTILLF